MTTKQTLNPEELLLNLLARINRDGGHYTDLHGLEKSTKDAEQKILVLIECLDRMRTVL